MINKYSSKSQSLFLVGEGGSLMSLVSSLNNDDINNCKQSMRSNDKKRIDKHFWQGGGFPIQTPIHF